MLSSGTAGRGTLLLLTITLVCRRGKYGPRSPEIMWQHLINVQPLVWLTADPPFVFLTILTSLSRRLLAHDLKTLVVARGKLARKLRRGHDFQTQSLLTG